MRMADMDPTLRQSLENSNRSLQVNRDSLEVEYWEQFLPYEQATELLEVLTRETQWLQPDLHIYGRRIKMPRLTAWYGDPGAYYTYSGIRNVPVPWTPSLFALKEKIQQLVSCRFNSVLLNLYRSGSDSMSWHRDDELELGPRPDIASVSLGLVRRFDFRQLHRAPRGKRKTYSIELAHGSLLMMRGTTQEAWEHGISKASGAEGSRINLTFRMIHAVTEQQNAKAGSTAASTNATASVAPAFDRLLLPGKHE
jgi:alkylated DNA repair dioxygenase AlkB